MRDRFVSARWRAAILIILLAPLLARPGWGQGDRGIGGTGVVPQDQVEGDRGIGGTGVIGTIRGFGSIWVNGLKIDYPPNVPVRIDGQPASAADLRVGHVVRVVAERQSHGLTTRAIDVSSEVVGPVEAIAARSITVLGQTVSIADVPGAAQLKRGDTVAVSGLRRLDGTIAASLIERWSPGLAKVAGPVVRQGDGSLRIGRLRLVGAAASLIGRRAIVSGTYRSGELEVASAVVETDLFGPNVRAFSIEAYVGPRGGGLRLGSGLEVAGAAPGFPRSSTSPSVVTVVADRAGHLNLEAVTAIEGDQLRGAPNGSPPPGVPTPGDRTGLPSPGGLTGTPADALQGLGTGVDALGSGPSGGTTPEGSGGTGHGGSPGTGAGGGLGSDIGGALGGAADGLGDAAGSALGR